MLLAIDPGEDTGWSLFDEPARLLACGLGDPRSNGYVRAGMVTRLIVERPRINPGGRARPNDMITLALRAGRWSGIFDGIECRFVEPWQWKGSVKKGIHNDRVLDALSADELAVYRAAVATGGYRGQPMAASKIHNMVDGIGLGLFGVGRGVR